MELENPEAILASIKLELLKLRKIWRIVALLVALLLTYDVLRILPSLSSEDNYLYVSIAWLSAIFAYLLANTRRIPSVRFSRAWWQAHASVAFTVGIIILAAFLLRVWQVGNIPFILGGDEASQGLEAVRVIKGQLRNPFTTAWLGVPSMSFFFNSISIRLLGQTIPALRLPWVLVGTVTVGITFFLVKRMSGTRLALATATLLAAYHYHIHFSRLGSNQIADPFFVSLALLFLYKAIDQRSDLQWALMGSTTGLAFYFYAGARLTSIIVILVLGYYLLTERLAFWNRHKKGILIALGAFLIVAAPMIQYAVRFPEDFNARLNEVGIIQSGWLDKEPIRSGRGVGELLFDQFRRAALAFNVYPDRTVWYGLRQPLLNPFFGILFILGMVFSVMRLFRKATDQREASMLIWWWSGMILGGMLTLGPPASQRLITLSVPVCFFIAFAAWEIIKFVGRYQKDLPANMLLYTLVLAFGVYSYKTYFVEVTPQRLYGGDHAEIATELAPLLNELSQDHLFYFVGYPEMYWGFATIPYLAPDANGIDIIDPITEQVPKFRGPAQKGAVYIFLPDRLGELAFIQAVYPNGEKRALISPVDNEVMVTLYILPPQR
jgi:4-amino-4-deoxy-L-arabinose transferase-like glycosyltransferase